MLCYSTEWIRTYKLRHTSLGLSPDMERKYVCLHLRNYFLDASKVLNRVNRHKLLTNLEQHDVPKYMLRVLSNEFHNQCVCVRWGSIYSDFFSVGNGVKQGGKLSPLLFNIYMHKQPTGCSLGTAVFNHLIYPDYVLLFAPSKDYKHYLTYVTPTDVTYVTPTGVTNVTPTDVSTTFNIMLVNPWSCTLTVLEMHILLGK